MKDTKPTKEIKEVKPTSEIENLISLAIREKSPVEALEKLLAMRKELKAEAAKEAYDKAMTAFQSECPMVEKTAQGYNYKYAPIEVIDEKVRPIMTKHGFSYSFDTDEKADGVTVYCKVKHIGGHMEVSKVNINQEVTTKMNLSQQSGSVMTYGKRYSLVNAFAIMVRNEDNDAATPPQNTQTSSPSSVRQEETAKTTNDTTQAYGKYVNVTDSALKIQVSQGMNNGSIPKDYVKLSKATRQELIALLEGVQK